MKCGRFPRLIMPRAAGLSGPFFQPTQIAACIKGMGNFLGVGKPGDVYFDFTKGFLDPRLTYARNDTVGTYFDSAGVLKTASANQPRFDHDPDTLEPLGILIEESRTNLVTYSDDFSDASWTKVNVTVGSNAAVGIDGTATADQLTASAANSYCYKLYSASSGTTYTFSVWVKSVTVATSLSLRLYDDSGVTEIGATLFTTTGSWQRITVTGTSAKTGNAWAVIGANATFSTGESLYVCGTQLEVGAFATSLIKTAGATATRQADALSCTGSNFSSWYRQDAGTVLIHMAPLDYVPGASHYGGIVSFSDGTNNNLIVSWVNSATANVFEIKTGGTGYASINGAVDNTTLEKWACAYATNNANAAINGTSKTLDTSVTLGTAINRMYIGAGQTGSAQRRVHIKSLKYWRQRIPDAALQQLTSWTYVAPDEEFDFLNETLDPLLTYARADTVGTRFNSSGVLETLSANQPRFDYDPDTLEPLGILIEESRTNKCTNTTFEGTPGVGYPTGWEKVGGYTDNITVVAESGPGLATNIVQLRRSATGGYEGMAQTAGFGLTAATWTFSVWVRRVEGVTVPSGNLSAYAAGATPNTGIIASAAQINAQSAGEWVRYSIPITFTSVTGTEKVGIISTNGDADTGFDICLPQGELGAFATSYIPTAGAAATRQADALSCTGSNFSSWYRQDQGTVLTETRTVSGLSANGRICFIGTDNSNRTVDAYYNYGAPARIDTYFQWSGSSGTLQADNGLFASGFSKHAAAYAADNYGSCANGGTVATDTTTGGSLANANQLAIGRYGPSNTGYLNGHIKSLKYWRQRIPDAALQVLTS